jgi:CHAT domain-containing protein/tetratricopeptide (TPR) repeat protein
MADHANGTTNFHFLLFCASRQPLFSAMSSMFFSVLRRVVVVIVLAAVGGVCVDILPASAQQTKLATPDRKGVDEAAKLNTQAIKLYSQGRYADAEPLFKRSLAIREKALGPNHPDVATSLNNLAGLYLNQGRYADAEPLFKRSLAISEKALGPDHPDVASSLNSLAVLYDIQGRHADAVPLFKRSLAIREKALGPDHPYVASSLNNLAGLYKNQGRYADAEPLYKRSLAIREKALGPNHPDVATSLNNLAGLYKNQGRYADAELLYKRSLAIREKALGPEHPNVAQSLNDLAGLYDIQGRYAEAEPLYKRSLAVGEKALGPDHPDVAAMLNNLAHVYESQGRYAEAEPLFKRSLGLDEKALGPEHPVVAAMLNNLAHVYESQGRSVEAEPLYKRSLAIQEKALGPDHPDVALSLNNLALLYADQARYADAEPLYKRSLAIREKALDPDHPDVATVLDSLAGLYKDQGRYADAEPLYKRSLAIREKALGPDHPAIANSLNNLAGLYDIQGRYADAEPLYKRSLAVDEKALGPEHPDVATMLNNLALLYGNQGRYADAEPLYKRSLAVDEKALGPDHPAVAAMLNNLALLYGYQGRYADAEPLYKRSLAVDEKSLGPDHPDVAATLNNLALLYENQGRYADALPIIERTITSRQAKKATAFPVLIDSEKSNLIDQKRSFTDSYNVLQFTSSSAAAEAVTKLAQRFAAGTDELATLVRRDQDLGAESETTDKAIIAAASKAPNERNQTAEDQLRKRIADIKTESDQIQSVLGQKFPDYVALSKPQPLTLQETQKLLADDEAVLVFDIGNKNSYAWVVTSTEGFWTEIPIISEFLNGQVYQLRQSLTSETNKPYDAALAHKIYKETFGPIVGKIAGKKRLSIVANGALTSIPFGVLVTSDPSGKSLKNIDWLIRSYAVTVIPSIYCLKTMRAQGGSSSASKPMIAFADPVFSKTARNEAQAQQVALRSLPSLYQGSQININALGEMLPPLPGTRKEVQAIAKELGVGSTDIKLGLDATETVVKQSKLDQYKIVYFATHGLVSGELEKFSKVRAEPALVLTIPDNPTELDDGLLQASEVSQLKLNADWVILSACNTASADAVGAEALSGLARAFLYAGARSLIVSHWEVDDQVTANLMTKIFLLMKNNPKFSHGEALQQAMLSIIEDASSGSRESRGLAQSEAQEDAAFHPRLWAPFVVVGEPAKQQ